MIDNQIDFPVCQRCGSKNDKGEVVRTLRAMLLWGPVPVCGSCAIKLREKDLANQRRFVLEEDG